MADTYRATVTRASASGVWVVIPRYVAGAEFGPLEVVANQVRVAYGTPIVTEDTNDGGLNAQDHSHEIDRTDWLADFIEVGEKVLVTNLGTDNLPDFVVIGVLRQGVS